MKRISYFIVFITTLFFITTSYKKNDPPKKRIEPIARWTGEITMEEITILSAPGLTGKSERHAHASFTNALPTMYRDVETTDLNFTDDKGTGTYTYHSEATLSGIKGCTNCEGSGEAELHAVTIREWDHTYDIEVIPPACNGANCDGTPYGPESLSVTVSNHQLGTNKDVLNGTTSTTSDIIGMGTVTKTITWHFVRAKEDDVELIVTPENYGNWLPVPGRNEMFKGSVITINLKLQGKNGKPLKAKAESFELRLNNTSKEPGITINYPEEPDPNQFPDLRFLLLPNIESVDEDQFTSVSSPDGITGKTYVASYDGGGWTTLTAEAILKDGRHIQGRLLKPGGEIDIRIPKRDPNSKIAEAWLKANGNPGEKDDKEKSDGNKNDGDGLTAYEEYRGVISEGKFKRLNPNRKELGILANQTNFSLFNEGMNWFKSASELEIIRFDIDRHEIPIDNRLNQNTKSAHDFDQYVVYITNGGLGGTGTLGVCYGKRQPMIPANVFNVVIDWNYIQAGYQKSLKEAMPAALKFTLKEYLAQTVAHELGHAVNIKHHGTDKTQGPFVYDLPANSNKVRIFDRNGTLVTNCHCIIGGVGYENNTVESGNMLCMLNYYPYYHWAYSLGADGTHIFNEVPFLPLGKIFCTSKAGTGINATNIYFGVAANGECKGQIQLRN